LSISCPAERLLNEKEVDDAIPDYDLFLGEIRTDTGTKEFDEMLSRYFAFAERLNKSGQYQHGAALQPVSTATTVRVRNGKTATTKRRAPA
jgi:hypothetical protein